MNPAPLPNSYWLPGYRLLAGEYPGSRDEQEARHKLRRLLEAGVDFFLDLTEIKERNTSLEPYEGLLAEEARKTGRSASYRRLAIRDVDVPDRATMRLILDELDRALDGGRTVYLHCWGGVGRTGTVVGCFLVRHGTPGQAALQEIARLRAGSPKAWRVSPETRAQIEMVLNWQREK